jgi:hypothetical protein
MIACSRAWHNGARTCTHTHTHTHTCLTHRETHTHTLAHTRTHTHTHDTHDTYTHAHAHTHRHVQTILPDAPPEHTAQVVKAFLGIVGVNDDSNDVIALKEFAVAFLSQPNEMRVIFSDANSRVHSEDPSDNDSDGEREGDDAQASRHHRSVCHPTLVCTNGAVERNTRSVEGSLLLHAHLTLTLPFANALCNVGAQTLPQEPFSTA